MALTMASSVASTVAWNRSESPLLGYMATLDRDSALI
jgi:hypothetical protein